MRLIWMVSLAVAMASAQTDSVAQRVKRGREILATPSKYPPGQATGILEAAVEICEANSDPACPDAYDWLGLALEHESRGKPEILSQKIAPLFGKAVERGGSSPSALSLELYGMTLQRLGDDGHATELLNRAVVLRRGAVAATANPPLTNPPPAVLRVGAGVIPPKILSRIEPSYTDEARIMHHQGTILYKLVVGTDGLARDFRLVKGLGLGLDEAGVRSIQQWRFEPGTKNGQPVSVEAQIEVNFRLL